MTEPRVSYKDLEEPTSLFVAPRLVPTVLVTMLILSCACGSTVAAPANQKNVLARAQRSQTMNDSSLSAVDRPTNNQGTYGSSISSFESFDASQGLLPLTVEVDDGNSCSADQYLNHSLKTCRNCTICGPGTQHKIDQTCGFGNGFEQICEPCPDDFYQDRTSSYLVRCKRCITCDPHAETIQQCTRDHNTQCGACPHGMYPFLENICVPCEDVDSDREECMMTRPAPLELTESSSPPSPVTPDAYPVVPVQPVQMISHTESADETGTPSKGTERPTTEPSMHGSKDPEIPGGTHRTGGNEAVTAVSVAIPTLVLAMFGLAFKFRKQRRENGVKESAQGKDADKESSCGSPEQKSVQVCYSALSQQEPHHDEMDQPQPLRSDLPFDNSQMGAICPSCNGPVRQGQDTPPASLSTENAAVHL